MTGLVVKILKIILKQFSKTVRKLFENCSIWFLLIREIHSVYFLKIREITGRIPRDRSGFIFSSYNDRSILEIFYWSYLNSFWKLFENCWNWFLLIREIHDVYFLKIWKITGRIPRARSGFIFFSYNDRFILEFFYWSYVNSFVNSLM